jgi:hypothetical protein
MVTKPQVEDENEFTDDELDDEDLSELLDEPDANAAIEPSTAQVSKKASVKVIPNGMTREAVDRRKRKRLLYERRRKQLDRTILALALRGKDESFKAKVYEIVIQTGLDPEDPAFLLLIATGRLELLLEESPKELEALFDQWAQGIHTQLQNYREGLEHYEALKAQEKAIAQSVQALIQKAAIDKFLHSINAISIAAGAVLILVVGGLGWSLGMGWATWQQARVEYAPGKPRQLTLEEATALKWATSSQGQFARHLMSWNQTLLARQGFSRSRLCEQDAKQLGITLELEGRKAKSGFCTLWIVPPNQRQF